jgi:hypothetical protein
VRDWERKGSRPVLPGWVTENNTVANRRLAMEKEIAEYLLND